MIRTMCFCLIGISLFCCKTEEIILHGDLTGSITDALTDSPLKDVIVRIESTDDSATTGDDGKYIFQNLTPGIYEILASKYTYRSERKTAMIVEANTQEINFALNEVPVPDISPKYLDFGLDSTIQTFKISNKGVGQVSYAISASQEWIDVNPSMGTTSDESDTIIVSVNRSDLPDRIHREKLRIIFITGEEVVQNNIDILVNGVMDSDLNYYGTVTIGTQRWLSENLNTGKFIYNSPQTDNGIVEKHCQNTSEANCSTFGGIYFWNEIMNYGPPDNSTIGKTRGICPAGWHIPTKEEWLTLIDYLGGSFIAGGKLKSLEYWEPPNTGATNESGFTALPAGGDNLTITGFWSSSEGSSASDILRVELNYNSAEVKLHDIPVELLDTGNGYVRCIKDPPK